MTGRGPKTSSAETLPHQELKDVVEVTQAWKDETIAATRTSQTFYPVVHERLMDATQLQQDEFAYYHPADSDVKLV